MPVEGEESSSSPPRNGNVTGDAAEQNGNELNDNDEIHSLSSSLPGNTVYCKLLQASDTETISKSLSTSLPFTVSTPTLPPTNVIVTSLPGSQQLTPSVAGSITPNGTDPITDPTPPGLDRSL